MVKIISFNLVVLLFFAAMAVIDFCFEGLGWKDVFVMVV